MNELINLLSSKVGLPQDKAQQAVNVVLGYVKDKLPAPISSQVENLISAGAKSGTTGAGGTGAGSPGSFGSTAGDVGSKFKK